MKIKFKVGDKVKVRQKGTLLWHDATIKDVGYTTTGEFWAGYDLDVAIGGFGSYWRSGVYYETLDPEQDNIHLIKPAVKKKKYKLIYDTQNDCYITQEI